MTLHIFADIEQRSEQWYAARRGIVTASSVGQLITIGAPAAVTVECPTCNAEVGSPCVSMARKTLAAIKSAHDARTGLAAEMPPAYTVARNDTSRALTARLAAERVTGWTEDTPITSDMWRGIDAEPIAREVYAENFGPVEEVGFMRRDEEGWSLGFSPDGLVGETGLIEIKAPRAKTHLLTILADEVPAHYLAQCQAGLLVSGREWIDYVSYVGGMPLYVRRVLPDPRWFDAITAACIAFEERAAAIVADYEQRVAGLPTTERIDFEIKVA
jgi:hypothetical protein